MISARTWHRVIIPVVALVIVSGYEATILDTYLGGFRTVAHHVVCYGGGRDQRCRGTLRQADGRVEDVDVSGVDPLFVDVQDGADVAVRDGPVGPYVDSIGAFLRRAVPAGLIALALLGFLVRRRVMGEHHPAASEAVPGA